MRMLRLGVSVLLFVVAMAFAIPMVILLVIAGLVRPPLLQIP